MKKATILVIILVAIVAISLVQAVQLGNLKTKVAEGGIATASAPKASAPSSSGNTAAPLPQSLQNLPDMVGGC